MDLFGALNNAFSGINRTQDALSVVAGNVAGANQPGYVRREYIGTSGPGNLAGGTVQRVLDSYVQKQLWNETAAAGYTQVQSDYVKQLDAIYGDPTSTNTIAAKFDDFSNAMKALQGNPGGAGEQSTVLSSAQTLTQFISNTSSSIQSLRTSAEDALAQSSDEVNSALANLAKINQQIVLSSGGPDLSLLDQRDASLSRISSLMDVAPAIKPDGSLTLTTKSGVTLLEGGAAAKLHFNAKSPLTATSQYNSNAATSGTGTLTLTGVGSGVIDLLANGALKSGKIAGLVNLRDDLLPKAQSQLDDLAAGLSSTMSDKTVSGTAVTGGFELDLSGIQSGNKIQLNFTDALGTAHHVSVLAVNDASKLPLSGSSTTDPTDQVIGVSFAGGVASALAAIQSGLDGLGSGLTVVVGSTGQSLQVTAASPAQLSTLSAKVTTTALQGQGPALPLFTDSPLGNAYTGSIDGTGQLLGFADRIIVNPQLLTNPGVFANYTGSTSTNDPTRINTLLYQLENTGVAISSGSRLGLPSGAVTVNALVKQLAQTQANDANRITSLNDSQTTILNSVQSRFNQASGVNMDKELTDLTQLQNVYAANAKVLSAVKDMFDVLMRI